MSASATTAAETWNRFRTETESCGAHLNSELIEAWKDLRDLITSQANAFRVASQIPLSPPSLNCLDDIFDKHASRFLLDPLDKYRRERPQQRALRAFEDWDRAIEGVIRAMPESISVSGPEWIKMVGTAGMSIFARTRLRWRREEKRVPFRQKLLHGFHRQRAARRLLEGRFLYTMANASLDLIVPWESMLQVWLPQLMSEPKRLADARRAMARLHRRLPRHEKRVSRGFNELHRWLSNAAEKMANASPADRGVYRDEAATEKLAGNYFRHRQFWVRQARAVDSDIDLECRMAMCERELVANARRMLASIEKEHRELLDELNNVMTWLENWNQSEPSAFPPAQADIISAGSRIAMWEQSSEKALERVPESIEVSSRLGARPRWRGSWRAQAPRLIFRDAIERQTHGVIVDGLEQLERQHQSIVREIERAREVVTFASETAHAAEAGEQQIEREGIENARSLLTFHREQTQHVPPEVERSLAVGAAAASLRTHTALEEGQFGIIRQGIRYGLPTAMRSLWRVSTQGLREGTKAGGRAAQDVYRETLIRIGWSPAPTARMQHVVTRGYLSHTLGAEFRPERLPMIYQRLFRLVPVDDPRFLIGRQHEMAALAEARNLWEMGREAGVIIVGERGSGKTSLVNCALLGTLSGMEVIRGEFSQRLIRQEQMRAFLSSLIGAKAQELEKELQSRRRIIILEELERTFLRRVNHYEALRALLNLISKTSKQALWILSTNYFSFRLLNASLRLDPHFSHRINAMAVDRDCLREAILMRHNLSGLRLLFAPPPSGRTYSDRLRKVAGVEADLEAEFFDTIYRESGGVFRTAFALWQRYIDRAEGGILYMKYPSTPQYDDVMKSLTDADFYTLAAIMQHGSLTPEEHSLIFQIDQAASNAWLDNLLARELIQPDPGRFGVRVIPEAGEIVRRSLFRRNVG